MKQTQLPVDIILNDLAPLESIVRGTSVSHLSSTATQSIIACRDYLDSLMVDNGQLHYGINTGFGYLQNVRVVDGQIEELQYNLLRSHACGMGETVSEEIIRLMLWLKARSLSYGYSGVQQDTVQRLLDMLNEGYLPVVFTQGSLGASGDLAPLSHLSLPIIGEGEVWYQGRRILASEMLHNMNWKPIALKSKEGLALINGTQFMGAFGVHSILKAQRLLKVADIIAALSHDAFDCNLDPFHPSIHLIRAHPGQVSTAARFRELLSGSEIAVQLNKQVQDPYSFRCIPQVHGASKDTWSHVHEVFLREVNSVTDNPNIFHEEEVIVSGGNFHGQPLALALDFLAIAMSEIANISERRTYQLISGQRGLPLFLVKDAGLHSGFMIPQYTAAGIVSENKQLCTPASVDSISSSNNQEDHVSMGANAAVKCWRVLNNVERVLAIEMLTAAQAFEFRRPLKTSPFLENVFHSFRKKVSFNEKDRILHEDMMAALEFISGLE